MKTIADIANTAFFSALAAVSIYMLVSVAVDHRRWRRRRAELDAERDLVLREFKPARLTDARRRWN